MLENSRLARKDHISIAKKILYKKDLTKEDIDMIKEELDIHLYLEGKSSYKVDVLYGKAELADGNNEEVIKYFMDAITKYDNKQPKAAYYGIFRAFVNLENYELALENLNLYQSCFEENFNMNFYFKVLYKLLELQGIEMNFKTNNLEDKKYINCELVSNGVLQSYKKAEDKFYEENYLDCVKYLKKTQNLIDLSDFKVDLTYLIKLVEKIYSLTKTGDKSLIETKIEKLKKLPTNEDKKRFLENEIEDEYNVYAIIELIKILVSEKDYKAAYYYLNHQMSKKQTEKYIRELNELRKIVNEEVSFKENELKINEYLNEAEILINNEEYIDAFKLYQKGFNSLSCPIFLFKIAELNYFLNQMHSARKYFIKYLDYGEKFKNESYIYLNYIKLITDRKNKTNRYGQFLIKHNILDMYPLVNSKAEEIYNDYIEEHFTKKFEDKDDNFNNYYNEIISNIKKGNVFRIEKINENQKNPNELSLIKICAAPILLEKGMVQLSDKYYKSAIRFYDDERIMDLAEQYKVLRKEKENNS